ncbi:MULTISPECIES: hypothetical protein [Bradyrhizobium]
MIENKCFNVRHRCDAAHRIRAGVMALNTGLQPFGVRHAARSGVQTAFVQRFVHEIIGSLREVSERRKERRCRLKKHRLVFQLEFERIDPTKQPSRRARHCLGRYAPAPPVARAAAS